jgi:hypothetical protein
MNCTFEDMTATPFGEDCPFEVYHGYMHIDNSGFRDPVILLSRAALMSDGIIEAVFEPVTSQPHSVVGLVIRAENDESFLLAGVNSRGQYTVQRCLRNMWSPVMGLDPFESSRLIGFDQDRVTVTAEVHGNYVDISINGQLIHSNGGL